MGGADLAKFTDARKDMFGRGGVIVARTLDGSGRQNARIIRTAQNDSDITFDAQRQETVERVLFQQRIASGQKEAVKLSLPQ